MMDQRLAEETLLLATRLQYAHREKFGLTELKQTAAEADIQPEFVDQAFLLLQRNSEIKHEKRQSSDWVSNSLVGFLAVIAQAFALAIAHGAIATSMAGWVTIAIAISLLGYYVPAGRRWPQALTLGALLGTVLTLLLNWAVWRELPTQIREGYWEHTILLALVEGFGFMYIRRLSQLLKTVPPSQSTRSTPIDANKS